MIELTRVSMILSAIATVVAFLTYCLINGFERSVGPRTVIMAGLFIFSVVIICSLYFQVRREYIFPQNGRPQMYTHPWPLTCGCLGYTLYFFSPYVLEGWPTPPGTWPLCISLCGLFTSNILYHNLRKKEIAEMTPETLATKA